MVTASTVTAAEEEVNTDYSGWQLPEIIDDIAKIGGTKISGDIPDVKVQTADFSGGVYYEEALNLILKSFNLALRKKGEEFVVIREDAASADPDATGTEAPNQEAHRLWLKLSKNCRRPASVYSMFLRATHCSSKAKLACSAKLRNWSSQSISLFTSFDQGFISKQMLKKSPWQLLNSTLTTGNSSRRHSLMERAASRALSA